MPVLGLNVYDSGCTSTFTGWAAELGGTTTCDLVCLITHVRGASVVAVGAANEPLCATDVKPSAYTRWRAICDT